MSEHLTDVVVDAGNAATTSDIRLLGGVDGHECGPCGRAGQVTGRRRRTTPMRWSRPLRRLVGTVGLVPVVLVAAALTGCTPTSGGTASVVAATSTLHFDAVSGRNNRVTVSLGAQGVGGPKSLLVTDSNNLVTPGPGCVRVDDHTVRCSFDASSTNFFFRQLIRLGDGNDTFASSVALGGETVVHAGAGDDTVNGGPSEDVFFEDSDASDRDSFRGGAGRDWVDYEGVMHAVSISLNDIADDGRPGEGDNVKSDIEVLLGTGNADTLTGDGDPNVILALWQSSYWLHDGVPDVRQLTGGAVINGGGGGDVIAGTDWGVPDRLSGGTGNDALSGYSGNDVLSGGSGDDILMGGAGFDALDGGSETDYCDVEPEGGTTINCETGP